ncbi:MAG: DegV family protein [Anaerolineae bacterium]
MRIVTDSVADLTPSDVARHQVKVQPAYLVLNGATYKDDGTLDRDWFYRQLADAAVAPTTAAPAPEEFLSTYRTLADEGAEDAIVLAAASSVSSIYDHALVAANWFSGRMCIHVVDTMQVSMGVGWMVKEVAEWVEQQVPVADILERVTGLRARTQVLGLLDSISYLRRSGRVGWVAGGFASLLRIKPLFAFEQGAARLFARVRTHARGRAVLLQRISRLRPFRRIAILHSGADAAAISWLRDELRALDGDLSMPVVEIGAAFATHVGPGCLGVAVVSAA